MAKYLPRVVILDYRKPREASRKSGVGGLVVIIGSGLLLFVLTMLYMLG